MPISDSASEQTLNTDTPDTVGLYMVLGVTQDATATEIKRAYRRLALRYHPDRNPGAGGEFVRIQYAYDVLSDERKRRIYDRYGEIGIQMAGRMGGELLDPQVTNLLSVFALASALVSCLFIAFFALLARRVDHVIEWSYKIVFMPLWVVDFAMVAGVVFVALARTQYSDAQGDAGQSSGAGDDNDDDDDDECNAINDHLYDTGYQGCSAADDSLGGIRRSSDAARPSYSSSTGSTVNSAEVSGTRPATDSTPLLHPAEQQVSGRVRDTSDAGWTLGHQQGRRHRHRGRRSQLRTLRKLAESQLQNLAKAAPTAYIVLLVAFQILLVLRLDGNIGWSIWRVAAPWLCIEGIHFVLLTLQFIAKVLQAGERQAAASAGDEGYLQMSVKRVAGIAASNYWWLAIRLSQAILIISKVNHDTDIGWFLVFAPSYVPLMWAAVALYLLPRQLRAMGDSELLQNERAIMVVCVAAFAVVSSFVYSFLALLVWKLSLPTAVRMVLVLIPVFVALGIACCCCSCLSFCLAYGMHATLDDEQAAQSPDAHRVRVRAPVPASRRINVAQPQ
ncbi:hypothetical protein GGF39_002336 [Coemansia sp. RSA 1721]|nr:hypothetical protein GGF39_002336 [Coemansia sp. RSA 1721]